MRNRYFGAFFVLFLIAADWPQFQGPQLSGVSEETVTPWKAKPKVLWSHPVGVGWSGPVVADGKLLIFHRVRNLETLDCIDATTGKVHWTQSYTTNYRDDFGFDEGPRATPAILAKEKIVVTFGADGELTGRNFADGSQLWQRNIRTEYKPRKPFFGLGSSPIVAGDKVILNVGGKGASIVAFDPKSGKELWKAGDDEVSYATPVLHKIDGADCAVAFTREGLLAVAVADGTVKLTHPWRPRNPNSVNAASPVVKEKQIFLSTSYGQGGVLLDTTGGKVTEAWKGDDILSAHYNTPVLCGDVLIGIEGRQEYGAKLRAIDWATGKILWTEEGFGCASLIRADKLLLALTEKGDLVLIDPSAKEYRELCRANVLRPTCRAAPALSGGRLYARDQKELVAVELKAK